MKWVAQGKEGREQWAWKPRNMGMWYFKGAERQAHTQGIRDCSQAFLPAPSDTSCLLRNVYYHM